MMIKISNGHNDGCHSLNEGNTAGATAGSSMQECLYDDDENNDNNNDDDDDDYGFFQDFTAYDHNNNNHHNKNNNNHPCSLNNDEDSIGIDAAAAVGHPAKIVPHTLASFHRMLGAIEQRQQQQQQEELPSASGTAAISGNLTEKKEDLFVILQVDNHQAPITCRWFPSCTSLRTSTTSPAAGAAKTTTTTATDGNLLAISVAGFRIVRIGNLPEEAEYKVQFSIDERTCVVWKKFQDFRTLAEACVQFSAKQLLLFRRLHGTRNNNNNNNYRRGSCVSFQDTICAWREVTMHRSWLWKNLSMQFLIAETGRLEVFLKHCLFEVTDLSMFLEFLC